MALVEGVVFPSEQEQQKGKIFISGGYWSRKKLLGLYFLISIVGWVLLYVFTFKPSDNQITSLFATGIISMTIFVVAVIYLLSYVDNHLLQRMVDANKDKLYRLPKLDFPHSIIFHIARRQLKDMEIQKTMEDPTKFEGFYGATTNGQTYSISRLTNAGPYKGYACITLQLHRSFDHCIIDACRDEKGDNVFNLSHRMPKDDKYDLEGAFIDQFDVYAPSASVMRAVTYVLTPDVMQQILDHAPSCDIEIVDNVMVIAWPEATLASHRPDWVALSQKSIALLNSTISAIEQRVETFTEHETQSGPDATSRIEITTLGNIIQSAGERRLAIRNFFRHPAVIMSITFFVILVAFSLIAVFFNINLA